MLETEKMKQQYKDIKTSQNANSHYKTNCLLNKL